jgi:hypothetical protein
MDHLAPRPVLLLVLDGIRPDVMRGAIEAGQAPNLGAIAARGEAVWDAVSVFPSITPAATAAIATGCPPAGSGIVGHARYDRGERRVIIYGAKTQTVIESGPIQVFHNNVWRMNRDDLRATTIFERLHEADLDGACVNFPIRRGPHHHPVRMRTVQGYMRNGRYLGSSVEGPKEYFMGDLFYSRDTSASGRRGSGGLLRSVGINDEYAAEIGGTLVGTRAAPFTLVYFFKGDQIAHHKGIDAQREHVAHLDSLVGKVFEAAGGVKKVLDEHVVISLSDHGHTPLLSQGRFINPNRIPGYTLSHGAKARLKVGVDAVVVPNGRAVLYYTRRGMDREAMVDALAERRGVDLAAWRQGAWVRVRKGRKELRFRPGEGLRDSFGHSWKIDGDLDALGISVSDDGLRYGEYPDALERLWGCLRSPRCGDLILSAAPGYTFGEVTGGYHVASDHGSLHESDSLVFSMASGVRAPRRITDLLPTVLEHFGASLAELRAV